MFLKISRPIDLSEFGTILRATALSLAAGLSALPDAAAASPAFPGAVGYGRDATGWRGGEIIHVTNLDDEGTGSFRACAEARHRRICVIDVAGTIAVSRPIFVGPNVYIAGQTAPGGGLQLRLGASIVTPLVVKDVRDVVIRHLKVRPGAPDEESPSVDAVTLENVRDVYLDHLSLAFATDETLNVHASAGITSDITIANSLLAFSLDRSSHPKGRHSKGVLICSYDQPALGCGRITLWRNLFVHHRDRNPDVKASSVGPVEIVNNLFYDAISQFGEFYNLVGDTRIAYVGNVTMPGPSTVAPRPPAVEVFMLQADNPLALEVRDVRAFADPPCLSASPGLTLGPEAEARLTSEPILNPSLPVIPSSEVVAHLLTEAGDRLPLGRHGDALDARAIGDVIACSGKVIDRPKEAGGWPEIAPAEPAADRDGDSLPDAWEAGIRRLDPRRANDAWRIDPETRMPWIERYLAEMAGDI